MKDEDVKDLVDWSTPAMQERLKLPDGKLSEIIDGKLYVWPSSPPPYHQDVVADLLIGLKTHVKTNDVGWVYHAPTELYLSEGTDVVIPDIIFISKDNPLIVDEYGLIGVPDMLIEVISKHTTKRDLMVKKFLYAGVGVKEYWIVDPATKDAQGFILKEGIYGNPLQTRSEVYIRILNKLILF